MVQRFDVVRSRKWSRLLASPRSAPRVALALILVLTLFASIAPVQRAAAADPIVPIQMDADGMPTSVFFPETGHHLSGVLLTAWRSTGLMIFGYPISEVRTENGRQVQYFERARLEVWPEYAGTQWEVQGTLLGNMNTEGREREAAFRPLPEGQRDSTPNRFYFTETGHSLSFGFKKYWEDNGGVWQFGFPISEEFQEKNPQDGNTYTVQYFERARFEYHPEHAGTQFEVLLGHLGRDYAIERKIPQDATQQKADSVQYVESLFDSRLPNAFRMESNSWMGYVSTDALGIREAPSRGSKTIEVTYNRHPIKIWGIVRGETVEGTDAWYITDHNRYVSAAYVRPLVLPTPQRYYSGHWTDVNLSRFYAVAYNGSTPVYVAIVAAGRDGKTPTGVFNVQSQVRYETMDSSTLGIPPGQPGHYYLTNVEYTQYFLAGGYAMHGNYWTHPSAFGGFTTNGCVGLLNKDAAFFWWWMNIGDVITIHF